MSGLNTRPGARRSVLTFMAQERGGRERPRLHIYTIGPAARTATPDGLAGTDGFPAWSSDGAEMLSPPLETTKTSSPLTASCTASFALDGEISFMPRSPSWFPRAARFCNLGGWEDRRRGARSLRAGCRERRHEALLDQQPVGPVQRRHRVDRVAASGEDLFGVLEPDPERVDDQAVAPVA
jgi:hypothetical protein